MYTKKIQITNYGPIDDIDITLPFSGENPKPIVLVGENGSGKSILLSHIVNALMSAQGLIYPENSEVERGKVYKLRSPFYIKLGNVFSFGRVDFENGLYHQELELIRSKKDFDRKPLELPSNYANKLWGEISSNNNSIIDHNFNTRTQKEFLEDALKKNCVLYFPSNRFEEPAWLNERSLRAKAEFRKPMNIEGYTDRKIVNYSSLSDNQNWMLDVFYDHSLQLPSIGGSAAGISVAISVVLKQIFQRDNLGINTTDRHSRKILFIQGRKVDGEVVREFIVPNIFQLSTGETSLLNLFLSILRDFDATHTSFEKTNEVRGIVVVDEIDLHLHAIHQYEILPELVKIFPRVQFIVTTHSPLFVLGMQKVFGEDGFALYRLPQGQQISPEEFSEFGSAYQSFVETKKFSGDMQQAVKDAQKPVVFVDGTTDVKYLEKAAELLNQATLLKNIHIRDGEGFGNLKNIWKKFDPKLAEIIPQKIILLHDCDKPNNASDGNVFKRSIPKQENHPLQTGIENLFEKATLEKAREYKSAFIDIADKYKKTERGKKKTIPEKWIVNRHEKTNLCNWLCQNGTVEDFKHFQFIFNLLQEILKNDGGVAVPASSEQPPQPEQDHAE